MRVLLWSVLLAAAVAMAGCVTARPPRPGEGRRVAMTVTAYCPCGSCCGWRRNWRGQAVYAYGPNAGQRKQVGICADGTPARRGVAAADPRYYPFGTRLYVPGYGYATVHDTGSAIRGPDRLDVFFARHGWALEWGRQRLNVVVLD